MNNNFISKLKKYFKLWFKFIVMNAAIVSILIIFLFALKRVSSNNKQKNTEVLNDYKNKISKENLTLFWNNAEFKTILYVNNTIEEEEDDEDNEEEEGDKKNNTILKEFPINHSIKAEIIEENTESITTIKLNIDTKYDKKLNFEFINLNALLLLNKFNEIESSKIKLFKYNFIDFKNNLFENILIDLLKKVLIKKHPKFKKDEKKFIYDYLNILVKNFVLDKKKESYLKIDINYEVLNHIFFFEIKEKVYSYFDFKNLYKDLINMIFNDLITDEEYKNTMKFLINNNIFDDKNKRFIYYLSKKNNTEGFRYNYYRNITTIFKLDTCNEDCYGIEDAGKLFDIDEDEGEINKLSIFRYENFVFLNNNSNKIEEIVKRFNISPKSAKTLNNFIIKFHEKYSNFEENESDFNINNYFNLAILYRYSELKKIGILKKKIELNVLTKESYKIININNYSLENILEEKYFDLLDIKILNLNTLEILIEKYLDGEDIINSINFEFFITYVKNELLVIYGFESFNELITYFKYNQFYQGDELKKLMGFESIYDFKDNKNHFIKEPEYFNYYKNIKNYPNINISFYNKKSLLNINQFIIYSYLLNNNRLSELEFYFDIEVSNLMNKYIYWNIYYFGLDGMKIKTNLKKFINNEEIKGNIYKHFCNIQSYKGGIKCETGYKFYQGIPKTTDIKVSLKTTKDVKLGQILEINKKNVKNENINILNILNENKLIYNWDFKTKFKLNNTEISEKINFLNILNYNITEYNNTFFDKPLNINIKDFHYNAEENSNYLKKFKYSKILNSNIKLFNDFNIIKKIEKNNIIYEIRTNIEIKDNFFFYVLLNIGKVNKSQYYFMFMIIILVLFIFNVGTFILSKIKFEKKKIN